MNQNRRILAFCCATIVLVPLLFYAEMILGGEEPPALDTMAVRPLGDWARAADRAMPGTPQWIPFIFSGMPSYGSYIYTPAAATSPLDWFVRPLAGSRGMRYYLFFLVGGFSSFLLFRRHGVSDPAAAAAALAFILTPYMTGVIEAGHSTKLRALMHAPLVLLAVDLLLSRPGALTAAFLALATSMLGWSNHPQILYYVAMIAFLQVVVTLVVDRPQWPAPRLLRTAGWGACALLVALLLLAEPTLAVREYVPYSIRGASEGGGASWDYATGWSFHPKEMITFLFPEFFGLKGQTYFGPLPFTQSTHYLGIVFLMLVAVEFSRRRDAKAWTWMGISLVLLLVGFGNNFPVLYRPFFEVLPYFDKFRVPSMIYSLLPLTLGFLLAGAIDGIAAPRRSEERAAPAAKSREREKEGDRRQRMPAGRSSDRRWIIAGAVLVAFAALALGIGLATSGSASGLVKDGESARIPAQQLQQLAVERARMRTEAVARGLLLVGLTCAAVPWARRRRAPFGSAVIGGLVLVDILVVGSKFLDLVDVSRLDAELAPTAAERTLQAQPGPFRVLPLEDFGSNRFAARGIETVGGYQPAKLKVYNDLIAQELLMNPSVLAMLNARFILSERDLNHPSFQRIDAGVFEFRGALPRAWFVPSWQVMPDATATLRMLGGESFDPSRTALLAKRPEGIPESGLPVRQARFSRSDPHTVRIEIEGDGGAGLLVVSEVWYPPGWRATIDGSPAEILQANHCLRAVVVPAGARVVEMRYASPAFQRGRLLNRAGAILLVGMAGAGYVLGRFRRSASSPA